MPWKPSAKNFKPSDLPEYSKSKKFGEEDEDKKRPARKGILDRDDVFKKPYSKEWSYQITLKNLQISKFNN